MSPSKTPQAFWESVGSLRIALYSNASPASDAQIRKNTQAGLAEEISGLERLLSSFRSRHNELSAVSRLPTEILTNILHVLVQISPLGYGDSPNSYRLGWITATHVCRSWRRIACDDPLLWTRIDCKIGHDWIREFALRSQMAALDYKVDMRYSKQVFYLNFELCGDVLTAQFHRIQKLSLGFNHELPSSVITLLSSPAPSLELLELKFEVPRLDFRLLPERLFDDQAHSFHTLHLENVPIDWRPLPFHGLTSLYVRDRERPEWATPDDSQTATLSRLIEFLSALPQLQSLSLKSCFPDIVPLSSRSQALHLPHLTDISLAGMASECYHLLDAISLPATCLVSISCVNREILVEEDLRLIRHVASFLQRDARLRPIQTYHMSRTGNKHRIRAWRSSEGLTAGKKRVLDTPPMIKLRFNIHCLSDHLYQVIFSLLPLQDTAALLALDEHILLNSPDLLSYLIRDLANLKYLAVDSEVFHQYLPRFAGQTEYPIPSSLSPSQLLVDRPPLLPLLESLCLTYVVYAEMSDQFLPALRLRQQMGYGLKLLELYSAGGSCDASWLGKLQEIVPTSWLARLDPVAK